MMVSRRNLLARAGGLAALGVSGLPFAAEAAQIGKVGLQLYTVRELFWKEPVATLERLARIGYREVEYGGGGFETMDHAMLRRTTDRLGLRAPSVHVSYEAMLADVERNAAMARTLGADTIVVPFMGEAHRTAQAWKAAMANFNRFGRDLKAKGLGFAYHNHDFEFRVKPAGLSLMEHLAQQTDPSLVKVELDLYWAIAAGEDVPAWIDRLSSRLYAFHVKDRTADGRMVAVGNGTVDFAALFKLKGAAAVRHFYVENDEAPAPYLPDVATSFATVSKLRF